MSLSIRLDIVAGLVVAVLLAGVLYRRYRARGAHDRDQDRAPLPRLPDQLVAGAPSTWVVYTTRYCATCEPVCQRLRTAYPDAAIVKVDAAERPDLARAFGIQRAPTVLVAGPNGAVTERLVGPEAVDAYLRAPV